MEIHPSEIREDIPLNILSIGAEGKWRQGYRGKGMVVAILDTGCETQHSDLKERIIGGYDFIEEHDGNTGVYEDLNGLGTHVAGILGGL